MSKAKQKKYMQGMVTDYVKQCRNLLKSALKDAMVHSVEGVPSGWITLEEAKMSTSSQGIFLNDALGNLAPECQVTVSGQTYIDPDFVMAITVAKSMGFKLQSEEYYQFREILHMAKGRE